MSDEIGSENSQNQADQEEQPLTLTLTPADLMSIKLIKRDGETVLDAIRRAVQDSLEYAVLKDALVTIDERISELSKKYRQTQANIINFRYDIATGLRLPEELRKKEDKGSKVDNLKAALEKKWAELEQMEKNKRPEDTGKD
ncbi:MAG TPA: hypothetical protein VKU79_07390 [Thermoplasmataceae archaeon]|nr:hypothetical protein [Thermoplasmatales archaeon AK]HLH86669.1 hypothetical protein [Thermoplasmataceae archaeon]